MPAHIERPDRIAVTVTPRGGIYDPGILPDDKEPMAGEVAYVREDLHAKARKAARDAAALLRGLQDFEPAIDAYGHGPEVERMIDRLDEIGGQDA